MFKNLNIKLSKLSQTNTLIFLISLMLIWAVFSYFIARNEKAEMKVYQQRLIGVLDTLTSSTMAMNGNILELKLRNSNTLNYEQSMMLIEKTYHESSAKIIRDIMTILSFNNIEQPARQKVVLENMKSDIVNYYQTDYRFLGSIRFCGIPLNEAMKQTDPELLAGDIFKHLIESLETNDLCYARLRLEMSQYVGRTFDTFITGAKDYYNMVKPQYYQN